MLEIKSLYKRYGAVNALDGFDLAAEPGEIVGLVGHNGAGKSTLARIISGLMSADSGSVRIDGVDASKEPRSTRRKLGYCPQEISLYPVSTARQNMMVFAGMYGISRDEARSRVDEVAAQLELGDLLDSKVRDLSGGQQRRVQAATAILHRPKLLLLDEPTAGADPVTRDALLKVVKELAATGTTTIYTTHYLPELEVLEASIAVAAHGRVIARGSREELLSSLPGRASLRFSGSTPSISVADEPGLEVELGDSEITITANDPAVGLARVLSANPEVLRELHSIELEPASLDDLYKFLQKPEGAYVG